MSRRDEMAKAYTYPNWPKKSDWERPERYETLMQYEVGYVVKDAFEEGWDASASAAEAREAQLVELVRELSAVIDHAMYLEHLGNGSTAAWAAEALEKARAKLTELNISTEELG